MLKIYNVYPLHGKIVLKDYITFNYGVFKIGMVSEYGNVMCGDKTTYNKVVNYEHTSINDYVKLSKEETKSKDSFNKKIKIYNPFSLEELEEKFKDVPKNAESYEKYNLNEEGILLFADCIRIKYENTELVQKILGRYPGTGLYLVRAGAIFTMSTMFSQEKRETYEVLQSENLGKQLIIAKLNRSIK